MVLAIDAGNTCIKYGLFDGNQLLENGTVKSLTDLAAKDITKHSIKEVGISSVRGSFTVDFLPKANQTNINHKLNFPFPIQYQSIESLGIDRLLACAGAYQINQNYCVIDIGTCMTIDVVDQFKGFVGGIISPGLSLRYKAMHNFTQKLPLVSRNEKLKQNIGNDTETCIQAGAFNGMLHEINSTIHMLRSEYQNLNIYLTGGDAFFFEEHLKNGIFVNQNLVLEGINQIIQLNK